MTKISISAALAALVLCFALVSVAPAQTQPTNNAYRTAAPSQVATPVALLDVSRVFKSHSKFKAALDMMKGDVQRVETWFKGEQDALRRSVDQLQGLRPGSPDYKQLEEQIAKRQSALKIDLQMKKKELMQQEAAIYFKVYKEIEQEAQAVAASRGFIMVLRYSGEQASIDRPDQVLSEINKPVVWFNRGLDITDEVLHRLESRYTASTQGRHGIPQAPRHQ
ncbi:MAG: OmpH family outer membrane protein [Pirellulales bacterium]|nr:OmpH family outer membrane protein [Pirellulales bacterium]